jgi:coenzyme F420-0:L-glutamate ligase/coenzyme F420-1:gamma-L-glutamate ligase
MSASHRELRLIPVSGLGEVAAGTVLGELIAAAVTLAPGDAVCISQKIVSKAEGRLRRLQDVEPSPRARALAERLDKRPELVELILGESRRVVRATGRVLIVETASGLICANAGIDASNMPAEGIVALLPEDPDASARRIRAELDAAAGVRPAVVIADSFGRPWRLGQTEVAIGCAGLEPIDDWRGRADAAGRELSATAIATADQLAAAADLTRTKDAGVPAVVVRGLALDPDAGDGPGAAALLRPAADDLFR